MIMLHLHSSVNFFDKANVIYENCCIKDIMKNIHNYVKYLKDNHVSVKEVTYNEKECLKIKLHNDT